MAQVLEVVAIIVSVVALIITVVGFFASLKFYRDGMVLQQAAHDALAKISEKTEAIQVQVSGMFDKTLDAAIGKHALLDTSFQELEGQLQSAKETMLGEVLGQIGEAGTQQQKQIVETVERQMKILQQKVESTRESAEGVVGASGFTVGDALLSDAEYEILRIIHVNSGASVPEIVKEAQRYARHPARGADVRGLVRQMQLAGLVQGFSDGDETEYRLTRKGRDIVKALNYLEMWSQQAIIERGPEVKERPPVAGEIGSD